MIPVSPSQPLHLGFQRRFPMPTLPPLHPTSSLSVATDGRGKFCSLVTYMSKHLLLSHSAACPFQWHLPGQDEYGIITH